MVQDENLNVIKPCQDPKQNRPTQKLSVAVANEMGAQKESLSLPSEPTATGTVSVTDSNSVKSVDRNSHDHHEDNPTNRNSGHGTNAFPGESASSSDYEEHSNKAMPTHRSSPRGYVQTTGQSMNSPAANDRLRENLPLDTSQLIGNKIDAPLESRAIKDEKTKDESNYHDYSRTPNDKSAELGNALAAVASGKEPPFPVKLHRILSKAEHNDVISWLPHGRSWRVLKPKAFEEKVIPMYFRHAKYASFMRQVNGWGFKRMTQGPDHNSYYHELFLRGLPHLCVKMRRPARAKNGVTDSETNPDFYQISMVHPLPSSNPIPGNLSALNVGGIGAFANLAGLQQQAVSLRNPGTTPIVAAGLGNMNLPGEKLGINGVGLDVPNTNLLLQQHLQGQLPQCLDAGQFSLQQAIASGNYNLLMNSTTPDVNHLCGIRREALVRQLQGLSMPEKGADMSAILNANVNNLAAASMIQAGLNGNAANLNGNLLSLSGIGNNPLNQLQLQQMISNYNPGMKVNQNQFIQNAAALGLMGFGAGQMAIGHNNVGINNLNTQLLMSQHSQGVMNAGQMGISPGATQGMNNLGNLGGIMMQNQLGQQQQFQAHQLAQAQIQQRNQLQQHPQQIVPPISHGKIVTQSDPETCSTNEPKEVEARV